MYRGFRTQNRPLKMGRFLKAAGVFGSDRATTEKASSARRDYRTRNERNSCPRMTQISAIRSGKYNLETHTAHSLNGTALHVWNECDGKHSVEQITNSLTETTGSPIAESVGWLALLEFKRQGLLEDAVVLITPFDGLTRREVVRRIGIGSLVLLPTVASLVAPQAAAAASGVCVCGTNTANARPGGCACNSNSQCCSGVCGAGGTTCTQTFLQAGPAPTCCPAFACAPANGVNLQGGCLCNGNANCASGSCIDSICVQV